jgi:hypothetical protein
MFDKRSFMIGAILGITFQSIAWYRNAVELHKRNEAMRVMGNVQLDILEWVGSEEGLTMDRSEFMARFQDKMEYLSIAAGSVTEEFREEA